MLKNKYVLGGLIAVAIFVVSAGGGILVMNHGTAHTQASLNTGTESGSVSGTNGDQPVTLSQSAMTGPQISANTGSNVGSSGSSDAAKLLDPTTFAQYDKYNKYKDAQTTQYADLQPGTGTAVAAGSQVAVVYKGWLTNGTLFDQSKAGTDGKIQAFSFVEGQHQVIPGWETGLEGVKEGGVRLLIIPPALGYGAQGSGPVPANAVLIFQVQIVQVK